MARHLKDVTTPLHAAISRLTRMDPPLIVAVNGTAGAGFSLALIGDLVVGGVVNHHGLYPNRYVAGRQFNISPRVGLAGAN